MSSLNRREVRLTHSEGLHLRAASQIAQLAQKFQAPVRVLCDGRAADGKSILELLMLAAERGARLELEAAGPDAENALSALSELFDKGLREHQDGRDESSHQSLL